MPTVGTPHVAKIAVGWTYLDTPIQAENIFHIQDSTDSIFADPVGTCNNIWTHVLAALVAGSSHAIIFNSVDFEDVRTVPFGGISVSQMPTAGTHSGGGDTLPSDVCIAVKKGTGNLGRSGRGRWYWPLGVGSALVHPDEVAGAQVTTILTALADFQAGVETVVAGLKMGIVSYRNGGVARPAGLFQQITDWTVADNFVDSQRRRLLGRGR